MFLIGCQCGKSEKRFKFNIGKPFMGECCKEPKEVEPILGDLNGDGVVDEMDGDILTAQILKGKDSKKKKRKK